MFAFVFSFVILQYALLCGIYFLNRLNQSVAFGFDKVSRLRKVLLVYKSLTLIAIQCNSVHKFSLVYPFTLLCGGTLTMSLYLVIVHNHEMGWLNTMMFISFLMTDGLTQAICYRFPSSVFSTSEEFIKKHLCGSLKVILKTGRNKCEFAEISRIVKALTPLKIQFFEGSFFDSLTPLIMIDFCLSRAIDLILMGV